MNLNGKKGPQKPPCNLSAGESRGWHPVGYQPRPRAPSGGKRVVNVRAPGLPVWMSPNPCIATNNQQASIPSTWASAGVCSASKPSLVPYGMWTRLRLQVKMQMSEVNFR